MYMHVFKYKGLPDTLWILMFSQRATAGHQLGHGETEPEETEEAQLKRTTVEALSL